MALNPEVVAAQLQELNNRLMVAETTAREANAKLEQRAEAAQNQLVDTKSFGKPRIFSGSRETWKSWSFGFTSFLKGANVKVGEALKWAEDSDDIVTIADVKAMCLEVMNSQLYLALSLQIVADTSAYVKIMNVVDSNGLEA